MRVAVIGLWHLGLVTAACLAKAKHQVIGYDPDTLVIENLKQGILPVHEPGLDNLISMGIEEGYLMFSNNPDQIKDADIVWINFDTPVNEQDQADVGFVINAFYSIAPYVEKQALVLFSSQLPVGTTRQIQQGYAKKFPDKNVRFGYVPENLRLGKAIQVFTQPDRFVVGLQDKNDQNKIKQLLGSFTENYIWMSIESAEMTKHALNAFFAVSVTFINEVATLCEGAGADAREVEEGLKSEDRIGVKAYLRPGSAIAGGTLLRDIQYLKKIGADQSHCIPLLSAVTTSNIYHKQWIQRKLLEQLNSLHNKRIAVLGLTYKANTDTLRRSSAVETCEWLSQQGAQVTAYDPAIKSIPNDYKKFINLKLNIGEALHEADAVIIATEWPDFLSLKADTIFENVNLPLVFDQSAFLMKILGNDTRIKYYSVGRNL